MTNLKQWVLLAATSSFVALACDDDTGVPPDDGLRRTTGTNCPIVGGGASSGNTAIEDGDCTTAGSGTSSGGSLDGGAPLVPIAR